MSDLPDIGVNPDLPRDMLARALLQLHAEDDLRGMRENLFAKAKEKGLAHPKDILVKRLKRSIGPSLTTKYAADIADLCYVIRHKQLVSRTLLKNGKRSAAAFVASRDPPGHIPEQTNQRSSPLQLTAPGSDNPPGSQGSNCSNCSDENRAISTLTRDLGNLRHEIVQLKSDIVGLRSTSNSDTCCIHVRLRCIQSNNMCESFLNTILHCPIICYSIIGRKGSLISLRVRIMKCHLHSALTSTDSQLVTVRLWRQNLLNSNSTPSLPPDLAHEPCQPTAINTSSATITLNLTTWNCRGLKSGEPYIHHLADSESDIIAVSEHWLWPFEADRLLSVHPAFTAEVKTDNRLTEDSTLRRGCGGVGIMWKKTIDATPITSINSDRICGIHVKLPQSGGTNLSVISVYLPCSDTGMEHYSEHLIELERVISEQQRHGPIIIMGDFNAHLGTLGGVRGIGQPNQQGLLLQQLITRCDLYVLSLASLSQGPQYTFHNSELQTTVDYILVSHNTTEHIAKCFTHDSAPLNTSDHLPITAVLQLAHSNVAPQEQLSHNKINWSKAIGSTSLQNYQKQVSAIITPLIGRSYSSHNEINEEIIYVSEKICCASAELLPSYKNSAKKKWYKDQTLSRLASLKKAAWDRWCGNGRPTEGPLYEAKISTRAEFRRRMRVCEANNERKRIQHLDGRFRQNSSNRFRIPKSNTHRSLPLRINGEVVTDPHALLTAWKDHFQTLSAADQEPSTVMCSSEVEGLLRDSLSNEDYLLDVPFEPAEIDSVLKKLKLGKAAGHDGVQAEHIKYGGSTLRNWILQICNAIIELECIPDSLKTGIITPIYKGGGKDPLDTNSHRGITLTSVFSKILESLILSRLQCHFMEKDIPHLNQTAYRRGVSCAEAIFSTLEVLSMYAQRSEKVYVCFYDLQKAFDSVQYPVLLRRLYDTGINGRAWRLLKSWYTSPKGMVRVNGSLSTMFTLERGVLQGSVLSPVLFSLIMDPLLQSIQSKGLGPFIGNTFAGAFIHADDIRTISSSQATLQEQVNTVSKFALENGLTLNPTKCEAVLVSPTKPSELTPIAILGDKVLTPHLTARCLGYWWSWDLSATRAVDEAIKKARRAFFAFGAIGTFHGQLNPISARSIYEVCVLPVLLFGCENWILSDSTLHLLESFQGEIGRRILRLSKHHSTLSTRLALKLPSVTVRVFIRKLSLLSKVSKKEGETIGCHIFSESNQDSLRLVQECRAMEGRLASHGITDALLSGMSDLCAIKKEVLKADWSTCISKASHHNSTILASQIASETSWLRLWDMALDQGPRGTNHLQALYRELTRPQFKPDICHLCGSQMNVPYFHHYTLSHTPLHDPDNVINSLIHGSLQIFEYAKYYQ